MVLLSAEVTGPSSCAETFESVKRRKVDKDVAPSQDESTKTAAALPILDLAWRNEIGRQVLETSFSHFHPFRFMSLMWNRWLASCAFVIIYMNVHESESSRCQMQE